MRSREDLAYLERSLVLFRPGSLVPKLVLTVRDAYELRHLLKQIPFDSKAVGHIAALVRSGIADGKRFRVFDTLKVLRAIIVKANGATLPEAIVDDIFFIYRSLILQVREDVQWCLSRLLKDQPLPADAVAWLLEHWKESEHIVNRLLRYPLATRPIVKWAAERYKAGDLPERQAELISLLICTWPTTRFTNEEPTTLALALVRSPLSRTRKLRILSSLVPRLPADTVVDVALRLGSSAIVQQALGHARVA